MHDTGERAREKNLTARWTQVACSGNILHARKYGGVASELSIAGKAASC